ncbi:hypothetical protein GGX14DRAFT_119507 [Mycena pura]|uniref:Fe2OG dioxygenase domain-containing protein n=1 Tax=Mycena pura TaxID=153505 RepID=A0AAD6VAE0_9AGAR|nr:hypothetical protein GGX14DRAFT_119507 [Mycena pura]
MFAKLLGRVLPQAIYSDAKCGPPRFVPPGRVDFEAVGLSVYNGCYAVVFDGLFSEAELSSFLAEAEASSPWDVAKINAGTHAITDTTYRNGERIIYDSFELSQKIFERIRPHLRDIEEIERTTHVNGVKAVQTWRMVRLNERLRFLRYHKGGFFRAHVDGRYDDPETKQRTFYTLQFYLPSDASGSKESFQSPQGGSTRFRGRDPQMAYADVESIPGRVLVFQHADLLHAGEEVTGGVKCTVRSDILYERVGEPVLVGPARTYQVA